MNADGEADQAAKLILGDLARAEIEVDDEAREILRDWLLTGARVAARADRSRDFARAVDTTQRRLPSAVMELIRSNNRSADSAASVGTVDMRLGLGSLCPLWPFC